MVLRKSSQSTEALPYPTSPTQFKAPSASSPNPTNHLDVDAADIPPIPQTKQREMDSAIDSPYQEQGNPWSQEQSSHQQPHQVLQVARATGAAGHGAIMQDTHEPLRMNDPGENTPRSSLDSQRSRNFWDDDEGDKDGVDTSMQNQIIDSHERGGQYPDPDIMPKLLVPGPISPGLSGIKRKPVASPTTGGPPHDQAFLPPSQGLATNNPFRRQPSEEQVNPAEPLSSSNAWNEMPQLRTSSISPTGKGKEVVRPPIPDTSAFPVTNPSHLNTSQPWLQSDLDSGFEAHKPNQTGEDLLLPEPVAKTTPPHPNTAPPPIPQVHSPFTSQAPLIPVSSEQDGNPWYSENSQAQSPTALPSEKSGAKASQYNDSLLDHGQEKGVISRNDGLISMPNAAELDSLNQESGLGSRDRVDGFEPSMHFRNDTNQNHQHDEQKDSLGVEKDQYFAPPEGRPPTKPSRPGPSTDRQQDGEYFEPPEGPPPAKPPRPVLMTSPPSDEKLARMIEQRNETYQIKHFNWFDHRAGRLRTSSMLTQNQNGPCPLLALVNALILGIKEDSQAALDNALRAREQVTLGLIIETLIDELLSGNHDDLPDVDELNRFLLMLHTGMNANPRFVTPPTPAPNLMDARNSVLHLPQSQAKNNERRPGSFEPTQDMKLYGAFSVPLVHGWLPSKRDPAYAAFARSAHTYEDAQVLQFGEEELEYKLSHGGLIAEEQRIWEDITSIKKFLNQHPTQLTPYGLEVIRDWLRPSQFAIMFRNDHFSTIYKHPDSGKLFTLITDAGYAERDEIVWESLTDASGASEFFSGDFRAVGGSGIEISASTSTSNPSAPRRSSQARAQSHSQPFIPPQVASPISPQERQEQHDADFAMALQLQEEEEQRANQNRRRSNTGRNEGNIPIRLRSREEREQEARPSIPPRGTRAQVNRAVSRPSDADAEDAPPAYEEAAKERPYIPPVGSAHHPAADPSPRSSVAGLANTVPAAAGSSAGPGPRPDGGPRRLTHQRRTSAYGENSSRFGPMPGTYNYGGLTPATTTIGRPGGSVYGSGVGPGRGRGATYGTREERDCIVM